jgi:hypothetical protein
MTEDIKNVINTNKKQLPILSQFWLFSEINNSENKEFSYEVISFFHNTSKYNPHDFYKPISTTIDIAYYE